MTKLTIRADQVKPGDTIPVGGHTLTVTSVNPGREHFALTSSRHVVFSPPDCPLSVDRLDPTADLIESMAAASFLAGVAPGTRWDDLSDSSKDRHRVRAEAALAVAKRLGAL